MLIRLFSSYMHDTHKYAYKLYHCNVLRCKVDLCEDRIYDRWECTKQWSSWISDQLKHKLWRVSQSYQISNIWFLRRYLKVHSIRQHKWPRSHFEFLNETKITQIMQKTTENANVWLICLSNWYDQDDNLNGLRIQTMMTDTKQMTIVECTEYKAGNCNNRLSISA